MSQQENDKFYYNEREYELISIEDSEKFINWESFGLHPPMLTTACHRGFINTFAIKDETLVLNKIYTNNQTIVNGKIETAEIRKINGVMPVISEPFKEGDEYRIIIYENLNYLMTYTGSLLIVKDFNTAFEAGPFAFLQISPFCYETIIKLVFSNGKFVRAINYSEFGEKIRNYNKTLDAYFGWPDLSTFYSNDMDLIIDDKDAKEFEKLFKGIFIPQSYELAIWVNTENNKSYILPEYKELMNLIKESIKLDLNLLLNLPENNETEIF